MSLLSRLAMIGVLIGGYKIYQDRENQKYWKQYEDSLFNSESEGEKVRNRLQGSDVGPEDDMLETPSIYRDWPMVQKGYQSLRMMNDNDNFNSEEWHIKTGDEGDDCQECGNDLEGALGYDWVKSERLGGMGHLLCSTCHLQAGGNFNAEADDYICKCGSTELRYVEYDDDSLNGFFCMNCSLSPCGVSETDDKPCTCNLDEFFHRSKSYDAESFSSEWHYFSECETKGCDGSIEYRDVYACPSCGQDDVEILLGDTCPDCGETAEDVSKYAIFYCSDCGEDYTDEYNSEVQTTTNKVRTISGKPLQLRKLKKDRDLKPEDAMDRLEISAEGESIDRFNAYVYRGKPMEDLNYSQRAVATKKMIDAADLEGTILQLENAIRMGLISEDELMKELQNKFGSK